MPGIINLCIKVKDMGLTQSLLETPLAQLSVKDFVELMNTYNKNYEGNTSNELFDEDSWLSGYKSLAKFLKCSVPTACRIVKSGKIDSAMRKVGGTYWFNKNMVRNPTKV